MLRVFSFVTCTRLFSCSVSIFFGLLSFLGVFSTITYGLFYHMRPFVMSAWTWRERKEKSLSAFFEAHLWPFPRIKGSCSLAQFTTGLSFLKQCNSDLFNTARTFSIYPLGTSRKSSSLLRSAHTVFSSFLCLYIPNSAFFDQCHFKTYLLVGLTFMT